MDGKELIPLVKWAGKWHMERHMQLFGHGWISGETLCGKTAPASAQRDVQTLLDGGPLDAQICADCARLTLRQPTPATWIRDEV